MIKYNKTIKIPYYDTDKNHKLSPVTLLKYLGEISIIHNSMLADINEMKSLNFGWMLNRWRVKVDKYPKGGEAIRIESWISGFEKFYANREFIIYDEENLEIGKATAVWIFIDMNRMRPIRITDEYYNLSNTLDNKIFEEFERFPLNMEIDLNMNFNIRRSDIDSNEHVNNTKYLEWMIESVPEEVYDTCSLMEFEIQYKKEIKYPKEILVGAKEINPKTSDNEYIHHIIEGRPENQNAAGLTKWQIK